MRKRRSGWWRVILGKYRALRECWRSLTRWNRRRMGSDMWSYDGTGISPISAWPFIRRPPRIKDYVAADDAVIEILTNDPAGISTNNWWIPSWLRKSMAGA